MLHKHTCMEAFINPPGFFTACKFFACTRLHCSFRLLFRKISWLHTILLSAECERSDAVAPFIHTRWSPLHTPAFSAAPPLSRLTKKRPFSPTEQQKLQLNAFLMYVWSGPVDKRIVGTFHRCEVDAQTRNRILSDVADSGWFPAPTLACTGYSVEVLTLGQDPLVFLPIQH